jgi:hypothetical protein
MPVMEPVRCGKSRLIRPGSRTFPIAIAEPTSTIPANSATAGPLDRTTNPRQISTSTPSTVCPMPNRRARCGAAGASSPKHSTGSAVSTPAAVAESPTLAWTSGSTGAIPTTAGRRLAATSTMAAANHKDARRARGRETASMRTFTTPLSDTSKEPNIPCFVAS